MVLHIVGFGLVVVSGCLLSLTTRGNIEKHKELFYANLYSVVVLIFLAELPFLYIINRLITQSLRAEKLSSEVKVQQVTVHDPSVTDLVEKD